MLEIEPAFLKQNEMQSIRLRKSYLRVSLIY